MTASPELIAHAADVTPEWLTDTLRARGVLAEGTTVVEVLTEPIGTGQMADTVRLSLTTVPTGAAPSSIIGKFASANDQSRATGLALRAYEIEVNFYAEVAARVDCALPVNLYEAVDPSTGIFTLLLEDIVGSVQGDQIVGCNQAVAHASLKELAGLHGPCWQASDLEHCEWLNRSSPESDSLMNLLVGGLFPGFLERYESALQPEHVELCKRFMAHFEEWLRPTESPRTVTHGDFRLDNLLFKDGDLSPFVVDWQTTAWGTAAYDVAYFVGGCLTPELRRIHERQLLEDYFHTLTSYGVTGYGYEQFLVDYQRGTFSGILMAIAASMLVERTERGDQMFLTSTARHAQHALDLNAESIAFGVHHG
jgi:hypothetical protein